VEKLSWLTDILLATSGTEQRRALRKTPRTTFGLRLLLDPIESAGLENEIFDGHTRAFGVPRWQEATTLTTDVSISDTAINVGSTAYADFRVGGLAVVWKSSAEFETLQISGITSTTLQFASEFSQAFVAPARVMPVATGLFDKRIRFRRFRRNLVAASIEVKILDNDQDLSDTSAFSSLNSMVFLDGNNFLAGVTISETMTRDIIVVDNLTGTPAQFSGVDVSRRGSSFSFLTTSRQGSWEVRQLLHALRGRQVSFYMASNKQDFDLQVDISSADQSIDVTDIGYTTLVNLRQPRNIIQVVKTDGTASLPLTIVSSSSPSVGVERLSFAPTTVGINATVEQIDRIQYVNKVRWDADSVQMSFDAASGNMRVSIPTMEVLE